MCLKVRLKIALHVKEINVRVSVLFDIKFVFLGELTEVKKMKTVGQKESGKAMKIK